MRLFGYKKADFARIGAVNAGNVSRTTVAVMTHAFEATGVQSLQLALTNGGQIFDGTQITSLGTGPYAEMAFEWLREQRERAELKESWSLTMEIAITLFVGVELLIAIIRWGSGHCA